MTIQVNNLSQNSLIQSYMLKKATTAQGTCPSEADSYKGRSKQPKESFWQKHWKKITAGVAALGGGIAIIFMTRRGKGVEVQKFIKKTKPEKVNVSDTEKIVNEIFSFKSGQYKVYSSKNVENGSSISDTLKLWATKKKKAPKNVTHYGKEIKMHVGAEDLSPHSYKEIPECFICTANTAIDYTSFKLGKKSLERIGKRPFDILPTSITKKAYSNDPGHWAAGITGDGRSYVFYHLNDGKSDMVNRPIRSIVTLVSPNNKFTQSQKDLISVLDRYSFDELKNLHKNPTSQSVIDLSGKFGKTHDEICNFKKYEDPINTFDMNLDVLLSGIHTWAKKETRKATNILDKLEKLKPGEYLTNI